MITNKMKRLIWFIKSALQTKRPLQKFKFLFSKTQISHLSILIFLLVCLSIGLNANPDIIAEVGNKTISWLQVQNIYENLWDKYLEDNSNFPQVSEFSPRKDLKKLAVDKLIRETLFDIYAEEHNITFSLPEIEAIFRQIYSDKEIFLTNGVFDKQKFLAFKEKHPKRYDTIVDKIKGDYFYSKIINIIEEQFTLSDEELYARYMRNNSKIKLAYSIVPDSLMPANFPSTPFYLNQYYKNHKKKYSSPRKVRIKFIFIEDQKFLPSGKSYHKYMKNYRDIAHRKSRAKAVELINKFQKSKSLANSEFHVFETGLLMRGETIGHLKNSENIIKFALIQKEGSVFSMPIEQDDGWVIFQTAKIQHNKRISLNDIYADVWQDYISTGKKVYVENQLKTYYDNNIKDKNIFKVNINYLKLDRNKLEFEESLTPDSAAIQKYYDENIEEFITVRDTLPLEEVIGEVIESLEEKKYNALADTLMDSLYVAFKTNSFRGFFRSNLNPQNAQIKYNIELTQNLPYFTEPIPLIIDTVFATPEDSIFQMVKDEFVYIGRVNSRKKLSNSRKRKLKPRLKELIEAKLYEERKENFDKYYSSNKNNFFLEDAYQFNYLYIKPDTTGIRKKIDMQKTHKIFLANKEKYLVENKVKLQTIFLDPKGNISSKIRSINSALRDSIDFAVLANIFYNQNHLTDKNGIFINIENLDEKIKNSVDKLHMGEISRPIITSEGYYIIKLLGRERVFEPEFEDVREIIISELIKAKADSISFEKAVIIYDSLEFGYKFNEFDSLGYVDTTSFIEIKEDHPLIIDQNITIYQDDFEPLYRTDVGNVIPKIFKQENGYAIVRVSDKIRGKKITGYSAYSFAKKRFLEVHKYNNCRIFTDYLSELVRNGNDSLVNYLGGMTRTGWLNYYDKIANLEYSHIILKDAFSRNAGAYSKPIRFSSSSFGFYHIIDKKIESRDDFSSIKKQYRERYMKRKFEEWLQDYRKEKTVIIYDF